MRRDGGSKGSGRDRVAVSEAAQLWGVTRATVYNWVRHGVIACFADADRRRDAKAARPDVNAAKVLRPRDLHERGVSPEILARALAAGVVAPGVGSAADRFSLDDLAVLLAFDRGERQRRSELPRRPISGIVPKPLADDVDGECEWVARGAEPAELSDEHFDDPKPRAVILPAGVFHYEPGDPVPGLPDARWWRRSQGYDYVDGELWWFEANDRFAILRDGEEMPREWVESNRRHRLATQRWRAEHGRRWRRWRLL
jgi:hypothetical protein